MDLHTPDHVRVICDSQPTHPNMIIIPFRNNSSSSTHRPAWSAVQGHNSEGFSATEVQEPLEVRPSRIGFNVQFKAWACA